MLGLGEVRCGAERVTCAFTTSDLQSHGFDLNESRPRVARVAGQWLFTLWWDCGRGRILQFCRPRSDSRPLVAYPAVAFSCLSAPTVDCSLPSEGLL